MPLQILIGVVMVAVLLIWFGILPPPHAVTLIRIRNGAPTVGKGHVHSDTLEHVSQILREAGVAAVSSP